MDADGARLTGVLEDDVQAISLALIGRPPEDMERAAANVVAMARAGADERRALAEAGVIHSLTIMCSREFGAKTQQKGAVALGALCSNFSSNMDESKLYVYAAAQEEALRRGAVTLITPILTAWQPDAQAAAANALADLCFRNSQIRRAMNNMEACRPLVNLLHSENVDVHKAAMAALRAYSVEAKLAKEVEDRGALSQVCKLLESPQNEVVARALQLLWALASADSTKTKIAKERDGAVLKQAVLCMKDTDAPKRTAAVALVRKLSTIPEHRQEVRFCPHRSQRPCPQEGQRRLQRCSPDTSRAPGSQLFDLGAHTDLVNALHAPDEMLQLNAMGALRSLASAKETSSKISSAGDLLPTLRVLFCCLPCAVCSFPVTAGCEWDHLITFARSRWLAPSTHASCSLCSECVKSSETKSTGEGRWRNDGTPNRSCHPCRATAVNA